MSNDLIIRSAFIEKIKLYLNRNFLGECTPNSEISVGELSTILKSIPASYDDTKGKGNTIELPCKPGDTVYVLVDSYKGAIKEIVRDTVEKICIDSDGITIGLEELWPEYPVSSIGKELFFSIDKAHNARKELENEKQKEKEMR